MLRFTRLVSPAAFRSTSYFRGIKVEDLSKGAMVEIENRIYQVTGRSNLIANRESYIRLALMDIQSGRKKEDRFRPSDSIEGLSFLSAVIDYEVNVFAYEGPGDGTNAKFSTEEEEVEVPEPILGMRCRITFIEDRPVSVVYPDVVTAKIREVSQNVSSTKVAILENGRKLKVPQFAQAGDLVSLTLPDEVYQSTVKK